MVMKVLIVDDDESVRRFEGQLLDRNGFCCTLAATPEEARARLKEEQFALALVDINMPGESGVELAKKIGSEHPETAAIMVTGVDDLEVANTTLEFGAYGYVVKPFQPNVLLIHIANVLHRRRLETENRTHQEKLEQTLRNRTASLQEAIGLLEESQRDVRLAQEETILRLARAGECRDGDTGRHMQRMSRYCALLAQRLGWDSQRCELIRLASILHDVGKIGIPDDILLRPGPLTPEELKIIQGHADIGHNILAGSEGELLQTAATIAWTHHEKHDGSGYPRGLADEAIPLEGKIATIADVFDALTTQRIYKPAHSLDKAIEIMRQGRGKHFGPSLLDLFLESMGHVLAIQQQFGDEETKSIGLRELS